VLWFTCGLKGGPDDVLKGAQQGSGFGLHLAPTSFCSVITRRTQGQQHQAEGGGSALSPCSRLQVGRTDGSCTFNWGYVVTGKS
jgi:hypothetical protein